MLLLLPLCVELELLLLLLLLLVVVVLLLLHVVLLLLLLRRRRPRSRGPLGSPRQNRIRLAAPTTCRGPAAAGLVPRPRLAAAALRGSGDHGTPLHAGGGRVATQSDDAGPGFRQNLFVQISKHQKVDSQRSAGQFSYCPM